MIEHNYQVDESGFAFDVGAKIDLSKPFITCTDLTMDCLVAVTPKHPTMNPESNERPVSILGIPVKFDNTLNDKEFFLMNPDKLERATTSTLIDVLGQYGFRLERQSQMDKLREIAESQMRNAAVRSSKVLNPIFGGLLGNLPVSGNSEFEKLWIRTEPPEPCKCKT